MKFIKTPVKGMLEQLPEDMAVREYVMGKIKESYSKYGFMHIETPSVEHIENLTGKQGGENEQLIFKILKRGEKLDLEKGEENLSDLGLRYDLTVPLSRFFANNASNLPIPFKAMQIGHVWRAERPQKFRYRQITQCDIDIIGDKTILAEIELINATANMFYDMGLGNSTVKVNDRKLLKEMARVCGFEESMHNEIFIALDKYDKIGVEGVANELIGLGIDKKKVDKYCAFFENTDNLTSCKDYFAGLQIGNEIDGAVIDSVEKILSGASKALGERGKVVFDPKLVRGMGYYTGAIFEVGLDGYSFSLAGGGRYDDMIGKFSGMSVPACGFSIGFERLVGIMKEKGFALENQKEKIAYLIEKDVEMDKIEKVLQLASELRKGGQTVLVSPRNKNVRLQKDKLIEMGYNKIVDVYYDTEL